MKRLHPLGEPGATVTSIRPELALDRELMRAGETIAEGAPPLSSAQVDFDRRDTPVVAPRGMTHTGLC